MARRPTLLQYHHDHHSPVPRGPTCGPTSTSRQHAPSTAVSFHTRCLAPPTPTVTLRARPAPANDRCPRSVANRTVKAPRSASRPRFQILLTPRFQEHFSFGFIAGGQCRARRQRWPRHTGPGDTVHETADLEFKAGEIAPSWDEPGSHDVRGEAKQLNPIPDEVHPLY